MIAFIFNNEHPLLQTTEEGIHLCEKTETTYILRKDFVLAQAISKLACLFIVANINKQLFRDFV